MGALGLLHLQSGGERMQLCVLWEWLRSAAPLCGSCCCYYPVMLLRFSSELWLEISATMRPGGGGNISAPPRRLPALTQQSVIVQAASAPPGHRSPASGGTGGNKHVDPQQNFLLPVLGLRNKRNCEGFLRTGAGESTLELDFLKL